MQKAAVTTELAKNGSYFVEKEKEEGNLLFTSNEKSSLRCTGFVNKRLLKEN